MRRALLARDGVVAAEFVVDESVTPGGLSFEPGMPTHLPRYKVHPADATTIWSTVVGDYTVVAVVMAGSDDIERAPGFEGDWPGLR